MNCSYSKETVTASLPVVSKTEFPGLTLFKRGQDKDLYDFGETLLVVATDRVAGSRVVIEGTIPGKGQAVNQMSAYWFQRMADVFPNHYISADVNDFPAPCQAHAGQLAGRSMLVKKATPLPVRCVVRGYLTGEGWQEYRETGGMGGVALPAGMVESQRLPAPLFIPWVKGASQGMGYAALEELCGRMLAERVRRAALNIYFQAWKMARHRGVLIAETTFEFGIREGAVLLIDECITPYSSLFWSLESYKPGGPLPVLGKEFLLTSFENRAGAAMPCGLQHRISKEDQDLFRQITGRM
jgi:phosphoribosylaminoimidazole-succinocarboxamide synthase